jgi:hypothetical protein
LDRPFGNYLIFEPVCCLRNGLLSFPDEYVVARFSFVVCVAVALFATGMLSMYGLRKG